MKLKSKLRFLKPITKIIGLVCIAVSCFIFQGCETDDIVKNSELPYLSLPQGFDLSNASTNDMNTLSKALGRLNVYKENGLYHIKQTSGEQVNISEDLFNFIKSLYDHTNKISKSHNLSYSVPRLKSGDPEDGGGSSSSDCMAYALSYAGGGTYGSVGCYLLSQYGSLAVPLSSFSDACHHFFPNGSTASIGDFSGGSMNNVIIIYMTGEGVAHAVNGTWYDQSSGTVIFHDEQSGGNGDGYLNVNDIINIYRP